MKRELLAIMVAAAALGGCKTIDDDMADAASASEVAMPDFTYDERGWLRATMEGDLAKVHAAARQAAELHGFKVENQMMDADKAEIDASLAQSEDMKQEVKIELKGSGSQTQLAMKVGLFGHQGVSQALLRTIQRQL